MRDPIDWEQAMESTRRSAAAASQSSEHAVAGMVRLLREMDRHSGGLVKLTGAIDKLESRQSQQIAQTAKVLDHLRSRDRPFLRQQALVCFTAFVAGLVCGGFFAS